MKSLLMLLLIFSGLYSNTFKSIYLSDYKVVSNTCDALYSKTAFDVCYSNKNKTPSFVLYKINSYMLKQPNLSRKNLHFKADYKIKRKFRSYNKDYSKTGQDKGHLAPNSVFNYSKITQKESFLLSNIAPQNPKLNRGLWKEVEKFTSLVALPAGEVDVVTGVCGNKGYIKSKVVIPKYFYKILFIGEANLSFIVKNIKPKNSSINSAVVDLKTIEETCGVEFIELPQNK